MTTVQQCLSGGQGCPSCSEDVIHQPELHLGCMDIGSECAAEVRQPLLTVEVVLACAGPGALQKIGADPAEPRGNQAWEGVGPAPLPAGDGDEHGCCQYGQGCSQTTDQRRESPLVGAVFELQQQAAERSLINGKAMPRQRRGSVQTTVMKPKPLMAWRTDRVSLSC